MNITKTTYYCDICKKELDEQDDYDRIGMSPSLTLPHWVKLGEGRPREIHFNLTVKDICGECLDDLLDFVTNKTSEAQGN